MRYIIADAKRPNVYFDKVFETRQDAEAYIVEHGLKDVKVAEYGLAEFRGTYGSCGTSDV
jgi:hypothetical protein